MNVFSMIKALPVTALRVLLIQWLTAIGYFSVIPFFMVYLVRYLHFSPAFAATQLTLFLVGQYGASFIGGYIGHVKGPVLAMRLGLALQIVCYLVFSCGIDDAFYLSCFSLLLGVSKAFFTPASKALLSTLTPGQDQLLLFSLRSTINNLGVAVGSGIGALMLDFNVVGFFIAAATVQIVALVLLLTLRLPAIVLPDNLKNASFVAGVKSLLLKPFFLLLLVLYALYSFLYIQLEYSFPLRASHAWGNEMVAYVFWVNALVVMCLQLPLNLYLSRFVSNWTAIFLGFLFMVMSFLVIGMTDVSTLFLLAIVFFTFGELIIDPAIDTVAGSRSEKHFLAIAFSLLGLAGLVGGVSGNMIAGALSTGDGVFHKSLWFLNVLLAMVGAGLAVLTIKVKFSSRMEPYNEKN
ncbi:MFS transporter [Pseudomonas sp. 6D_7.1_Bac1]|uniref:MFS transporter n=1 Tax=Pseudomonas sp. 6D_7.1_Bac1 TaxID=2971615 RepID=UPI0021C8198C|nr:MFS transporter [Pseudomonas sp. 6D_7.1_Bac1]MCU1750006.1 MFS transporter [Pseudomonas sp. 6D_7.1_Bac1]